MNIITNTSDLNRFCQEWSKQEFITVDLEFLREHSYYAKLCLIQVGSLTDCAIIDPLAPDLDLQSFFEILQNPQITKVFHSGRQDIEILYYLTGNIPLSVYDTQIAAMVAGFGESVSYENLVRHILHKELDKSSRLSDWSARPLKPKQLDYALSDVTHLVHIYEYLRDFLEKNNRASWIEDEMRILCSPETYIIKPEEAWERIHHRSHNPRFLTILRELAAWREERSQRRNTPRQSYLKDDTLLLIASSCPKTREDLVKIRNLRKEVATGVLGTEILEVIQHFGEIPEEEYVVPPKEKPLPSNKTALFELLKLLLKLKSHEQGVVPRIIATEEDLLKFSGRFDKKLPFLKGWRYEIFGKEAEDLRRGNLAISYNPQSRQIEFITRTAPENPEA